MHRNVIGARFGKIVQILIRIANHQMHIQWQVGAASETFDYRRADRQIGHEVTVHYINMNPIGMSAFGPANFFPEA